MTVPVDPATPHKKNHMLLWLTCIFLAIGLGWFLLWFFYLQFHENTDDAYVNGYLVNVTPLVEGAPIAFFADDTDFVKEGQLLVLLDPTDQQLEYEAELKKLASDALQVKQLAENVKVQSALAEKAKAVLENARYDFENRRNLVGLQAVSQEDFVHSQNSVLIAEADLKYSEEQLALAKAALGSKPAKAHPLIEARKERVRQAYYRLRHTAIYAPVTGHVVQRNVEVGQWASLNRPLLVIVPQEKMWVDANFKESQLKYMRIGQPASVAVDLYGGSVDFKGKVIGISSGTGSVFSAIPPQNATGNWIKVVQRLAVRVAIDANQLQEFPLRLGLSAYVNVDIADTDLPVLTSESNEKPIFKTNVMEIDFSEVDRLMQKIILANLE